MRLLHRTREGIITPTSDIIHNIPPYAILSHTWGSDEDEVTLADIRDNSPRVQSKVGYRKIQFCGEQAAKDGIQYFWVDTCCIDKANHAELVEALNSMFRWYRDAAVCYVYLADVQKSDDLSLAISSSRWATRGWTLQELIAPSSVEFFSSDAHWLGNKQTLEQQLENANGIPVAALRGNALDSFSVEERMSWVEKRQTTKEEDRAYCLLGIFDIFMVPIYGEGAENAFYRLNNKIKKRAKVAGEQGKQHNGPPLRSNSIFAQERLVVRPDVQSFLNQATAGIGQVRIVLQGIPGIGKSTMARYFAYSAQQTMAILWIPGESEQSIKEAFEQYAQQLFDERQKHSDCVSLIGQELTKRFPGNWLVIFDGLNLPFINIQPYLFADLEESKILITTRNEDLKSYIKATHVFSVKPLDGMLGQELLGLCVDSDPDSTMGSAPKLGQTKSEIEARRRIVDELGGLPLAISIVGAALRQGSGSPNITSQAYLGWPDDIKNTLLAQDPSFTDYPSSVWNSFDFAFRTILQGDGFNRYASAMAHLAASCESASHLATLIRLYRQARTKQSTTVRHSKATTHPVFDQLRFLEIPVLELAINSLAAVGMITVHWPEDKSADVPHVEMHSLVRKWFINKDRQKVSIFVGPKLWLCGSAMLDQFSTCRTTALNDLFRLVIKELDQDPEALKNSPVSVSEVALPVVLDAHIGLSESVAFLPVRPAQRRLLSQLSEELESDIRASFEEQFDLIDWTMVFRDWARQLGELIADAVRSDSATKPDYSLKDIFLDTLDSHGCIPIAFEYAEPLEPVLPLSISSIEDIKWEMENRIRSALTKHSIAREAFSHLGNYSPNESQTLVRDWVKAWGDEIAGIIQSCITAIFIGLQTGSATDANALLTVRHRRPENGGAESHQTLGDYIRTISDSSDPTNAFFAVLRRAVEAATEQVLESFSAEEMLDEQSDFFRDTCELAIREVLADRADDIFQSQPPSAESDTNTIFSMVWRLAWPARFPGALSNLIAKETFNAISQKELKNIAKRVIIDMVGTYLKDGSEWLAEEIAYEITECSSLDLGSTFPNWIRAGWIDYPESDAEDSDADDPDYIALRDETKKRILAVMRAIYDGVTDAGTTIRALEETLDYRRALHDEVMSRLNRPGLTDRTGMGPFFAKMCFDKGDKALRLACALLGDQVSVNMTETLDGLIRVENEWTPVTTE